MQRYKFSHYLCIVFRDKVLEYNKESALYSLKSPNYQEVYTRHRGQLILVGCPTVRIYRCLAIPNEYVQGQPKKKEYQIVDGGQFVPMASAMYRF